MQTTIPNAGARYRPRADAATLSELLQATWQAKSAELEAMRTAARVGHIVATHLESRFPATDMAVLLRYGAAKAIASIGVRIYDPATRRWDITCNVDLPREVVTPGHWGATEVSCGGPRWSRQADRGVSATYRAELESKGEWQAFCADQDKREAAQLPESVEPFFAALVAARAAYQAEYRQAANWPADRKSATGEWPTWAEIEAAFPTLGGYVAAMRAAPVAIAA